MTMTKAIVGRLTEIVWLCLRWNYCIFMKALSRLKISWSSSLESVRTVFPLSQFIQPYFS